MSVKDIRYDQKADAIYILFNDIPYSYGKSLDDERHIDYGATVIVFNTGATSRELSESLTEGVWGEDAVSAYRAFLNPGK